MNDQLCDFEPQAVDPVSGLRFANAPEGGKQPRRTALGEDRDSLGGKRALSSQAPTIVLNTVGLPVLALGSPGGSCIISAVLSVLHTVIDRGTPVQDATNAARALARNSGPRCLPKTPQNGGCRVRPFPLPSSLILSLSLSRLSPSLSFSQ